MKIYSYEPFGYYGNLVEVNAETRESFQSLIYIAGIPDNMVKGFRERIKVIAKNIGTDVLDNKKVLIGLSPCDIKKNADYEFPILLKLILPEVDTDFMVLANLDFAGNVLYRKGLQTAIEQAKKIKCNKFIIPKGYKHLINDSVQVIECETIQDAIEKIIQDKWEPIIPIEEGNEITFPESDAEEITVDERAMKNLVVAMTGGHNILFYGAPGCGKTKISLFAKNLMPKLTQEKLFQTKKIYEQSGLTVTDNAPFRMPHQTCSIEGMCGGGANLSTGEITLAHNGVLFLDEAAEFRTSVLQVLRVPMESKSITLARAGRSTVFPADFQLILSANPCPCGNYGNEERICLCSARSVELYWKKFSEPLLNRIEIKSHVSNANEKLFYTEQLREIIKKALERQYKRQGCKNHNLTEEKLSEMIPKALVIPENLLSREKINLLKVALTIADLKDVDITQNDINEAIEMTKFNLFMSL